LNYYICSIVNEIQRLEVRIVLWNIWS